MAPRVTGDDIREIERQVKYLWSNQMPEFLTKPAKSSLQCQAIVHSELSASRSLLPLRLRSFIARSKRICFQIEKHWDMEGYFESDNEIR